MKRRIALFAVAIAILGVLGIAAFALHTHAALRWTLGAIENRSNGMLRIGSADGTLSGPIVLHDVEIKSSGFDAKIQRITLNWLPVGLLANRLDITNVNAEGIDLNVTPTGTGKAVGLSKPVPPYLPVVIVVSNLNIADMHVTAPQLTEPMQITRVHAAAYLDNGTWSLSGLSIEGPQIHAQGHGIWEFKIGQRLDAALDWNLSLPQHPPFKGRAIANGDEQRLHLNLVLQQPADITLDAELRDLFSVPAWQGKLSVSRMHLQQFSSDMPAVTATGSAHFAGSQQGTDFEGELNAYERDTGNWRGKFALRYEKTELNIRKLELERTAVPTRFQIAGSIDLSDLQPAPDLHGEWQNLSLPLTGNPWLESPHGTLRLTSKARHAILNLDGTLAKAGTFSLQGDVDMNAGKHDWQLTARAHDFNLNSVSSPYKLPAFDWRLLASGDVDHTQIENLAVKGFGGDIRLHGVYQHGGTHGWQASVTAHHLDPASVFPDYKGDIGFTAQLQGHRIATPAFSILLKSLQGNLRSMPISMQGSAEYANRKWLFRDVDARLAENRFRFDGHLGRQTAIHWDIHAPDLKALWPGLGGKLETRGNIELAGNQPAARFSLHAAQLTYAAYRVGTLDANVSMNNADQAGDATLKALDVVLDGKPITQLDAHAHGTLLAHALQLTLSSPMGHATLDGEGQLAGDVWQGNLQTVSLEPNGAGTWQAESAWHPSIGINGFALSQACVTQADAHACGMLSWHKHRWQANVSLDSVPLSDLQALLPPGLEYAGSFNGNLKSSGDAEQHRVDVTASLSPGSIHNVVRHRRVTLLDYTRGDAHIHIDSTHTTGSLNWSLRDGGFLNVDTRIANNSASTLKGHIRGELHDFELIPALIPDVSGFEGKFNIDLKLGGTAGNPTFNGTASLQNGAIRVPRLGLNVSALVLDLQGNGNQLNLSGTAHSGQGKLEWNSTARKQNGIWHARGHLAGANFRAVDIPEAQVDISPELDFTLDDRDINLNGGVEIPFANIRPRNLSNTAQVSTDQVIVGQNEAAQEDRWHVHARIRASMGDDVDIKGFGLSGRITGDVLLVDEPGHFTTGTGELQIVDGQYTAYRQNLSIERGRLMFNGGPVSNPALDIKAIRKPAHPETIVPGQGEQQVGVIVRGTLRDPNVSLFSNPPLPQSSLLAYLLTGQLPSTPSQSPLMGQPTTDTGDALTYSGGEFLAQQVGNQIGLPDVSIQNVSTGIGSSTPSLFIGKYLSPRLYVSYGAGLLQSINTIRIRYTLSTRWMLEAESGAANSADLIYTLEH